MKSSVSSARTELAQDEKNVNYILDDKGNPIPEPNLRKWGEWFDKHDRVVKQTYFPSPWEGKDAILVSTIFLAMDHRLSGSGPPILWETMIFRGEHDQYQERYSSLEAARQG